MTCLLDLLLRIGVFLAKSVSAFCLRVKRTFRDLFAGSCFQIRLELVLLMQLLPRVLQLRLELKRLALESHAIGTALGHLGKVREVSFSHLGRVREGSPRHMGRIRGSKTRSPGQG